MRVNLGKMRTPALMLSVHFTDVGYEESPFCIRDSLGRKPSSLEDAITEVDIGVAAQEGRKGGERGFIIMSILCIEMERSRGRENTVDVGEPLGVRTRKVAVVGAEGFDLGHGSCSGCCRSAGNVSVDRMTGDGVFCFWCGKRRKKVGKVVWQFEDVKLALESYRT